MPLGTQARLLRVLENGEFIKVGSSKVLKTEVRVIAASNVNLEDAVAQNKFREDLYYRLNTVPIQVPALRERGKDILLLFRKFAADFSEKYRNKEALLNPDAQELIVKHPFPGNIRQLKICRANECIGTRSAYHRQLADIYQKQNQIYRY